MAQKTQVTLVDDLDGSDATQTVTFAFQGTSYEIDLNDEHATSLDVLPRDVDQPGDGRDLADGGVGSVMVVPVEEGR